ncbi:MAG: hypothetical protein O2854_08175 [Chloroflexi bacterium]|nr:hypothetical protein [Chloroflexota bacterium]
MKRMLPALAVLLALAPAKAQSQADDYDELRLGQYVITTQRSYTKGDAGGILRVHQDGLLVHSQRTTGPFGAWIIHQPPTDVTGDGVLDLVALERTGGANCCRVYHVFSLGEHFEKVGEIDTGHGGWEEPVFVNLDTDPQLEIGFRDDTFAYWQVSLAGSPMPGVVVEFRNGAFRLDAQAMRQPPTIRLDDSEVPFDETNLASLAQEISRDGEWQGRGPSSISPGPPAELWSAMLGLIYSGNARLAWELLDRTWPDEFVAREGQERTFTKGEWRALFLNQLSQSPYWEDLRELNRGNLQ